MAVELARRGSRFFRRLFEPGPPPSREQLAEEFRKMFRVDPYNPNARESVLGQVEALQQASSGAFFVDSANTSGAAYNPVVQLSARATVLAAEFGISTLKPQS